MEKEKMAIIGLGVALLIYFIPSILIAYEIYRDQKKQGLPTSKKVLFDERQKLLRSQASFHALLFLCGYLAVWALVHQLGIFSWTTMVTEIVFCGLLITFTLWKIECCLRDVMIGWNQNSGDLTAQLIFLFCFGFVFIILGALKETNVMMVCMMAALSCWVQFGFLCYTKHRRSKAEALSQSDHSDEEVDAP